MRSRLLAGLAIGALLLVGSGTGAAGAAADPTYPTGSFAWDNDTKYLHEDNEYGDSDPLVQFFLRATSLTDDVTPGHDLIVKISFGATFRFAPIFADTDGSFLVELDHAGTFTPRAEITDGDGRATVVDLPTITVLRDTEAPTVTFSSPGPATKHRVAGWRIPHGTITDSGVGIAYAGVDVQVMQRRGSRWSYWSERYPERRWLKGKRTLAATEAMPDNGRFTYDHPGQPANTWQTEPISGLRQGAIVVCFEGMDSNRNYAPKQCVTGRITRR